MLKVGVGRIDQPIVLNLRQNRRYDQNRRSCLQDKSISYASGFGWSGVMRPVCRKVLSLDMNAGYAVRYLSLRQNQIVWQAV